MKPLKKKDVRELVKRAKEISAFLNQVKPLYKELDEITMMLVEAKPKALRKLGVALVDNYATKNTAFRIAAIKRFEIEFTGIEED